jgi:hypothetical protein
MDTTGASPTAVPMLRPSTTLSCFILIPTFPHHLTPAFSTTYHFQPPRPTNLHEITVARGNQMSSTPEVNRENAQHSTGPRTEEGKQKSSLNALRHGLTGQIVVMPREDMEAYKLHLKSFTDEYKPEGATEANLVQALADTTWRLNRVAALETNLLLLGMTREFVLLPTATQQIQDAASTAAAVETQSKALATLSIHSQRLSRQFERTITQLRDLQKTRQNQEKRELDRAIDIMQMYKANGKTYDQSVDGFVFSAAQLKEAIRARNREHLSLKARDYPYEYRAA